MRQMKAKEQLILGTLSPQNVNLTGPLASTARGLGPFLDPLNHHSALKGIDLKLGGAERSIGTADGGKELKLPGVFRASRNRTVNETSKE